MAAPARVAWQHRPGLSSSTGQGGVASQTGVERQLRPWLSGSTAQGGVAAQPRVEWQRRAGSSGSTGQGGVAAQLGGNQYIYIYIYTTFRVWEARGQGLCMGRGIACEDGEEPPRTIPTRRPYVADLLVVVSLCMFTTVITIIVTSCILS